MVHYISKNILVNMTTHFIEAEIDLQETPAKLNQEIKEELSKRGDVVRWAVTKVNEQEKKAHVEAIVTQK